MFCPSLCTSIPVVSSFQRKLLAKGKSSLQSASSQGIDRSKPHTPPFQSSCFPPAIPQNFLRQPDGREGKCFCRAFSLKAAQSPFICIPWALLHTVLMQCSPPEHRELSGAAGAGTGTAPWSPLSPLPWGGEENSALLGTDCQQRTSA